MGNRTRQAAWNETGWTSIYEGGYKSLDSRYAVQAEDRDADGIGSAADALALNGGSIRSAAGADAVLDLGDHASVNAADHKVGGGG